MADVRRETEHRDEDGFPPPFVVFPDYALLSAGNRVNFIGDELFNDRTTELSRRLALELPDESKWLVS